MSSHLCLMPAMGYSNTMNIKNMLLGPMKAEVKIVGVSNYTDAVRRLSEGAVVLVEHEPTNEYDSNAMRVTLDGETVGYFPKVIAERMVGEMAERSFVGHIAYTTHHDGQVVGGAVVLDKASDESGSLVDSVAVGVAPALPSDRPVF